MDHIKPVFHIGHHPVAGFCGRLDLAQKKQGEHPGSVFVAVGELGASEADKTKTEAAENAELTTQEA